MIRYIVRVLPGCLLLVVLMVSGCAVRNAPKVNYFSLLSMAQLGESQAIATHPEVNLGIGPVTIPESLKRSQIAIRRHGNQYDFDEFNRWAGVLEKDFTAVVGENLSVLLGVENVDYFPWMPHFTPNYRVVIDIQRFDGSLGGEAVLEARWSVADTDGKKLLAGGRSALRRKLTEPGYAGLVKAESFLVADFCKQMAGAIGQLIANK